MLLLLLLLLWLLSPLIVCRFYFDKYEVINEPSTVSESSTPVHNDALIRAYICHLLLYMYFYFQVIINTSLSLSELDVRLCGGTVTDDFNESVTHIVFDKR